MPQVQKGIPTAIIIREIQYNLDLRTYWHLVLMNSHNQRKVTAPNGRPSLKERLHFKHDMGEHHLNLCRHEVTFKNMNDQLCAEEVVYTRVGN